MPSKQNRPTVNDRISDRNLMLLSFGMMLVGKLVYFIKYSNWCTRSCRYSWLCIIYSIWSKRHTTWNTVVGSFPGAVPPLMDGQLLTDN